MLHPALIERAAATVQLGAVLWAVTYGQLKFYNFRSALINSTQRIYSIHYHKNDEWNTLDDYMINWIFYLAT